MSRSYMTDKDDTAIVFPFLKLEGQPVPKKQRMERVWRAGVAGIGLLREALRGEPFGIRTLVDVTGDANVTTTKNAYLAARGGVYDLYWQGVLFDHVVVLDVIPQRWQVITGSVGGVNPSSTRVLPAVWTLEAVT